MYLSNKNLQKYISKIKNDKAITITFFGTPAFSAKILKSLIEFSSSNKVKINNSKLVNKPEEVELKIKSIVTQPDKPVGRKQMITESEVSVIANNYSIPVLKPLKFDPDFIESNLDLLDSDFYLVVSFGKIIPKNLLEIPTLGSVNIHGSILPKYRGASPIQESILQGDKETGISFMLMDENLDHGPVLDISKIDISDNDTSESLSNKLALLSSHTLIEFIPKFLNLGINPKEQNHKNATFTKVIKKEDGYFDINNIPKKEELNRKVRAYFPWPNVWTRWNSKIVKLYPQGLVQIEGKNAIPLKDFLNGYPDFPIKDL